MAITTGAEYLKSPKQQRKDRRVKKVKDIKSKVKRKTRAVLKKTGKNIKTGVLDPKKAVKKTAAATKKVAKSTGARIASVASKALRSPVGKFGPLGAAVTLAYYAGEEFGPKKKAGSKTTTTKKPTAKSVPSSFGAAFKKAYKANPGGTFTYKGKKYKAVMKKPAKAKTKVSKATIIGQGGKGRKAGGVIKAQTGTFSFRDTAKKVAENKKDKTFYRRFLGESDANYKARIARKEKLANKKSSTKVKIDKKGLTPARTLAKDESKISKATMMGGTPFGMPVDEKKKARKYDPTKANRAGQRMGQRMAGGMMKKYDNGGLTKINPQKQPGLAALKKKAPGVVAKMGYAKNGTMVQARGCGMARKTKTKIT